MRLRDTLSSVSLALIGTAALTAGALVYQMARRPPQTATSSTPSAEDTDEPAAAWAPDTERPAETRFQSDRSLLRRLREGGL